MLEQCFVQLFSRSTRRRWQGGCAYFAVGMMGIILISGCAAVRPAVPLSPQNPANPAAAESSTPPARPLLTASESDLVTPQGMADKPDMGAMDHENHKPNTMRWPTPPDANSDPEMSYFCLMHPEVKAAAPGSCPICSMKLVQKKPEPPVSGDAR